MKKQRLPKGFLSKGTNPTMNSVEMYMVYLSNLPEGWNENKLHEGSLKKVRQYFGVDYGFGTMILWGLRHECSKSKTSNGRFISMSTAKTLAKAMLGNKVLITRDRKIPFFIV